MGVNIGLKLLLITVGIVSFISSVQAGTCICECCLHGVCLSYNNTFEVASCQACMFLILIIYYGFNLLLFLI